MIDLLRQLLDWLETRRELLPRRGAIMSRDNAPLTVLQRRWLALYLHGETGIRYNARQSAIAAGYSERSAHELGSRCLNNPKLRRLIDAYLDAEYTRQGLTRG